MLIHLRLAQLVLDLPDCEPLFALEIVNFTKPFNWPPVESQEVV